MHLSITRKVRRPFIYKGRFKSLRSTFSITHISTKATKKRGKCGKPVCRFKTTLCGSDSLAKFLNQVLLAK